jgi:lysophospholipase L1-like esterase
VRPDGLARLVQFCHPPKILSNTRLPGALDEASVARLYGTSARETRRLVAGFEAHAATAARRLLDDPTLRRSAAQLPRGTLVALGDSITDDLQSWAEILRQVLRRLRPRSRLVNAGLSGDTTTAAIARVRRVCDERPAWVLVLIGTNDARRHGPGAPMLVSHDETARNLRWLERALGPRVAWIVPPPVLEDRIAADPDLSEAGVVWRAADVRAKGELVRHLAGPVADPAFGSPPDGDLLLPDGLHPSLAGQERIAAAVIRTLAGR